MDRKDVRSPGMSRYIFQTLNEELKNTKNPQSHRVVSIIIELPIFGEKNNANVG